MAVTTSKIVSGYEDPNRPGKKGPSVDLSEAEGAFVKNVTAEGVATIRKADWTEEEVTFLEAAKRISGDDIQSVVVSSDALLLATINAQAGSDEALLLDVEDDVSATISGTVYTFKAGDLVYFPPRSRDAERWFNRHDLAARDAAAEAISEAKSALRQIKSLNEYLVADDDDTEFRVYQADQLEGILNVEDLDGDYLAVVRDVAAIIPSAGRDAGTDGVRFYVTDNDDVGYQVDSASWTYRAGSTVIPFSVSPTEEARSSIQNAIGTTPGRIRFALSFFRGNSQTGGYAYYDLPINPDLRANPGGGDPSSAGVDATARSEAAKNKAEISRVDRAAKGPRIRFYPESIPSLDDIEGNYRIALDNVVEEILFGPSGAPIDPEISRFKLTEIGNGRSIEVHNSGWLFSGADYEFDVEISAAEAQSIVDESPDTFLVFVGEFSNRDRSTVILTNEVTVPIGDVAPFPSTRGESNRIAQDVAHNRNLLADMEQEEFVRWVTSAPGDGALLVFPSSAGGSYSQPILQVPDATKALPGVGWVDQWVRPDPGANPGYDPTDESAWQNLFSIIVRLKHRSSQADFRVLLPGALRNSPIGLLSSSYWVSFHSDDDWDYYLYSVASALPQNVSLSDFYVPVGDGYTLQHHGPQRHTIYRGKVQALEEYDPHTPRRVDELPHVMLRDELLVLEKEALHPESEQRWNFTPDSVVGYNPATSLYTNRYYGAALPNVVDTSTGDTGQNPRNDGAAGWGSDLSAIFQTNGIRALYARTSEENTLYLVLDKDLISDADAAKPGEFRISLLLPLAGSPEARASFWSRSVVADEITTQATTRTLAFTITHVRSQLSLQTFAVTDPGGTVPSLSLRHNTDYLRINSGTVEFSGAGVSMARGLYRGTPEGDPEHVQLTRAPRVLYGAVARTDAAGVQNLTLPEDYADYRRLAIGFNDPGADSVLFDELITAVMSVQTASLEIAVGNPGSNARIRMTWNPTARTLAMGQTDRIIFAELHD